VDYDWGPGILTFTIPTLATPRFAFRTISKLITKRGAYVPQVRHDILRFTTSQFDDDNYPHQNTMTRCLVSELPPFCRDWLVNLSLSVRKIALSRVQIAHSGVRLFATIIADNTIDSAAKSAIP
jgi:hypothetical protein